MVVEAMNDTAWDAEGLAWADLYRLTRQSESHRTLEPINRFFVSVVAVGYGNLGSGGNGQFED